MKNVNPCRLKQCIILTTKELEEILAPHNITVEYDYDGVWFSSDKAKEVLGEHFGVKISTVHIDDCDVAGVWLCLDSAEQTAGTDDTVEFIGQLIDTVEDFLDRKEGYAEEPRIAGEDYDELSEGFRGVLSNWSVIPATKGDIS